MDPTHDVFLSYSSKDKPVIRDVATRLKKDGLRVWFDEWEIKPGDNILAKIEEGLERSRVLVLCMSVNAFGADWAQLESGTFRFRDPLNRERRFIPLRLDDAPIKGSLAQFLYIKWLPAEREQEYAKLLEACRATSKQPVTESKTAHKQRAEKVIKLQIKRELWGTYDFSLDSKRVLISINNTVQLWDVQDKRRQRIFKGHKEYVQNAIWSADQKFIFSSSHDHTMRQWDASTGRCLREFVGHTNVVYGLACSIDRRCVLSCSADKTIRVWSIDSGKCLRVLKGHTDFVYDVALSEDQHCAVSGGLDNTVRIWDVDSGQCLHILNGHTDRVVNVALSADGRRVLSGSDDKTIRLWEIKTGRCIRIFEGHNGWIRGLAWSNDGRFAISGSFDMTIRLWEVESGRCLRVLKGHSAGVISVAWKSDLQQAYSGDTNGEIRIWDLIEFTGATQASEAVDVKSALTADQIQYTNAKVLLVGESGAGKTGLTERLAHDRPPQGGPSTAGAWSTQWPLQALPQKPGWEREVWLWDFGGQADQRLIHQLYVDRTALVMLLFNADQEIVLPGLRDWQQSLTRCVAKGTQTFVVAGRTDVGFRFDREKVRAFAKENDYQYFETSAETGIGIIELRNAMLDKIPWADLPAHSSPALFKQLKDEILKLRDEGLVLVTFKELESILRNRLPATIKFADAQLETVVSLLDGPGVVKELGFGTYILLRPEWINAYAQAVIRTLRAAESGLGCLPTKSIMEGKLIFQTKQADGEKTEEKRLSLSDERVVLQAMEQTLLERRLCLSQGADLVFPSHCGLERPTGPVPPKFFASYTIRGFLDDIYATLIVKLAHSGAFVLKQPWRDGADFETLADRKIVGIKLVRREDGRGELLAHHARGVTGQEQVIFANYIHEHLREKVTEEVPRLRFYTCPECDEPVLNRELAKELLEKKGESAKIRCQRCDSFIPLWDTLEKRFASETLKATVETLRNFENRELDSRRKGKLLALEVAARITSADQKCFDIPGVEDEGLDMEVEFTDAEGRGSGKRLYLQLKAGNSYLHHRKRDGAEIFKIKKQSWVKYWLKQVHPVLLVIGTFPNEADELRVGNKERFADIRYMEISEMLRQESKGGTKPVKQIVFRGERLDTMSVRGWRNRALARPNESVGPALQ